MKLFKNSKKFTKTSKYNLKRLRKNIRHNKILKKHYSPTLSPSKQTSETNPSSMIIHNENDDDLINLVPSSFILFDDDNKSIINLYDFHEELESTKEETENNFEIE